MRALIADDDRTTTILLRGTLARQSFDVTVVHDGEIAWQTIAAESPSLALIDWMMPGVDGLELCRRIRAQAAHSHMYLILLTSRAERDDVVAGLDAGADDYLVKPFDPDELRARVQVGIRIMRLQSRLAQRVEELQATLANVKQLRGLLPICSYCKRVRSDENYWQQVEQYVSEHTEAQFSHGICPPCYDKVMDDFDRSELA
jgi:DNA-binding response OmpR family regulator